MHPIPQKFLALLGSFPLGAGEERWKFWPEVDVAEKRLLSCPTALGGDVCAGFHTPTAPRGQLYLPPR